MSLPRRVSRLAFVVSVLVCLPGTVVRGWTAPKFGVRHPTSSLQHSARLISSPTVSKKDTPCRAAAAPGDASPPSSSPPSTPFDIHEFGAALKTRGLAYRDAAKSPATSSPRRAGYALAALANLALFTVYRAYRGFFVILPAVFTEVRSKLERRETASLDVSDDLDPRTGRLKLRSAILMNLGAAVFTFVLLIRTAVDAVATRLLPRHRSQMPASDDETGGPTTPSSASSSSSGGGDSPKPAT